MGVGNTVQSRTERLTKAGEDSNLKSTRNRLKIHREALERTTTSEWIRLYDGKENKFCTSKKGRKFNGRRQRLEKKKPPKRETQEFRREGECEEQGENMEGIG